jgi:hypothetical protein
MPTFTCSEEIMEYLISCFGISALASFVIGAVLIAAALFAVWVLAIAINIVIDEGRGAKRVTVIILKLSAVLELLFALYCLVWEYLL